MLVWFPRFWSSLKQLGACTLSVDTTFGPNDFRPKRLSAQTIFGPHHCGPPPPPSKNNVDRVCVKASLAAGNVQQRGRLRPQRWVFRF